MPVHPQEAARVRRCGLAFVLGRRRQVPDALREGVQLAAAAELDVHDQTASGRDLPRRRSGGEAHDLAVLRAMRDRAGLSHVDPVATDVEARGDDVAERDQRADIAVPRDAQHAVVVPVADQKAAPERVQRVLNAAGHEEIGGGRMRDRPRADIRDRRRTAVPLDPVDAADHVGLPELGADERDQHVRGATAEGHVHRSADAYGGDPPGQAARECRDRARPRIHAQHAAAWAVRHVQRPVGTDRAARAAAAGAAGRGERGQLVHDRPRGRLRCARRRSGDRRRHRRGRRQHHGAPAEPLWSPAVVGRRRSASAERVPLSAADRVELHRISFPASGRRYGPRRRARIRETAVFHGRLRRRGDDARHAARPGARRYGSRR